MADTSVLMASQTNDQSQSLTWHAFQLCLSDEGAISQAPSISPPLIILCGRPDPVRFWWFVGFVLPGILVKIRKEARINLRTGADRRITTHTQSATKGWTEAAKVTARHHALLGRLLNRTPTHTDEVFIFRVVQLLSCWRHVVLYVHPPRPETGDERCTSPPKTISLNSNCGLSFRRTHQDQ